MDMTEAKFANHAARLEAIENQLSTFANPTNTAIFWYQKIVQARNTLAQLEEHLEFLQAENFPLKDQSPENSYGYQQLVAAQGLVQILAGELADE